MKSRSFLALAHPGGPGKRVVKQLWCGGGASKSSVSDLKWYSPDGNENLAVTDTDKAAIFYGHRA